MVAPEPARRPHDGRPRTRLQGAHHSSERLFDLLRLVLGLVLSVLFAIVGDALRGRPEPDGRPRTDPRLLGTTGPDLEGADDRSEAHQPTSAAATSTPSTTRSLTAADPLGVRAGARQPKRALPDSPGRPGRARAGVPPRRPRQPGAAARAGPRRRRWPHAHRAAARPEPGHARAGWPDRAVHPTRRRTWSLPSHASRADSEVLRSAAARRGVRRGAARRRPRPPGGAHQPEPSLPRDGGALRRARLRRLGQGDDDRHRRAAGQPRRRTRPAVGSDRLALIRVDGPDAGGRLVDLALPRRRRPPAGTRCARAPGRASTTAAATRCRWGSRPRRGRRTP